MSRRSLRINDSLLDRSLPHSAASFSLGGATAGHKNRSLMSRRLSSSCSESLLPHTPRKVCNSLNSSVVNSSAVNSSAVHSVAASDASLLSSLLDESSIQESTSVDGFWGLDSDADPKESTLLCESAVLADSTVIGPDSSCFRPRSALIGREPVCVKHSKTEGDRDQLTKSKHSGPPSEPSCSSIRPQTGPGPGPGPGPEAESGTGPGLGPGAQSPEETPTIYCRGRKHKGVTLLWLWIRRWFSCILSVLSGLKQNLKNPELTEDLQLWLDCSLSHLKRAALLCGSALSHTWRQVCDSCGTLHRPTEGRFCVSAMKESSSRDARANGALCGAAARAFRWVWRKWSQMNKEQNKRFPLGVVLVLVLLFAVVFSFLWCGLSSVSVSRLVHSELPFLQTLTSQSTEPGPAEPQSTEPDSNSDPGPGLTQSTAVQTFEEPETATETSAGDKEFSDLDLSRVQRLEQSLSLLWKQVEGGGSDSAVAHGDGEDPDSDLWTRSSVLEQQLDQIRTRLEQELQLREQAQALEAEHQQSHAHRLERIEQQLNELSARTLELEVKQAAALRDLPSSVPAPFGSEAESQVVLFTELSRLQGALHSVRQELQTLSGCRGRCSQFHSLQDTVSAQVSAQVQEQVWTLVFGPQVWSGPDSVSKPLVQVMSERFVSELSLQGVLSALERRILEQVLNQQQKEESEEELPSAGGAVTHQEVYSIVHKALRKFSEDRTGLADFALESGGGSIVSTRCSQTFETKAALLSLFGFPLWYFSQSPRTVIQPDVNPGNCWAFRGSSGEFLIRLSSTVLPSGFTLEHTPRSLSPTGTLQSAPKDFSVYGLSDEEEEEGALLGTYVYNEDGDALQSYSVMEENTKSFQFILVRILSNWGHEEYTCVYRFRVHGTPTQTRTQIETETLTETETETDLGSETDPETETETETNTETGTDLGTETETETLTETETETDPGTETEIETLTETETDPGTETETETKTNTETGTGTDTETETRTETDPETETGTETDAETGAGAGFEAETGPEPRSGSEREMRTESGLDQEEAQGNSEDQD